MSEGKSKGVPAMAGPRGGMERAQELLDQLVYMDGKKRERSPDAAPASGLKRPRGDAGTTPPATRGPPTGEATCRPWIREDLLRRLRTFSSRTWFCKLDKVSAIRCASKGWVNSGVDALECESCRARAIYPPCASAAPKDVDGVATKFVPLLDSLHDKFCPWRGRECEDGLLRFPLATPAKLLEQLKVPPRPRPRPPTRPCARVPVCPCVCLSVRASQRLTDSLCVRSRPSPAAPPLITRANPRLSSR